MSMYPSLKKKDEKCTSFIWLFEFWNLSCDIFSRIWYFKSTKYDELVFDETLVDVIYMYL